jgi:hypothetical protein
MIGGPSGRALAQLVYETTDTDFADRALEAMRKAHIPCYDFSEANRILISLGAVEERPLPLRLIFALLLVAAILAISAALAWNP